MAFSGMIGSFFGETAAMRQSSPRTWFAAWVLSMAAVGCNQAPAPRPRPSAVPVPAVAALDLSELDIQTLQDRMRTGRLTSRRITQWYLDRIAAVDDAGPTLNAVIAINPDALAIADQLDAERRGPTGGRAERLACVLVCEWKH